MKFGRVAIDDALGAIAAHSVHPEGARPIRKGTVIGDSEIAALRSAGVPDIVVARLDPDDVPEDEAALRLARLVAGANVVAERPFTGRVNLFAAAAGVVVVDKPAIDRFNAVDEAMTFATLPAFAVAAEGRMVGTVKIIPFAVPARDLERAAQAAGGPVLSVAPFRRQRVALIQTAVPGTPDKMLDKTRRVSTDRLAMMGAHVLSEQRVPHRVEALAEAVAVARREGAEAVLIFGASAISDRADVIPAAIERAGGRVVHYGMPVDPGNLLLFGDWDGLPVIGAPGCARSPKENGFDWVLARVLADVPVRRADITGMGVGGLLMEIASRPQPREGAEPAAVPPKIAALVLAAGRSTRMGGPNKLLEEVGGVPVVRRVVEALSASGIADITLVTGHMPEAIAAAAGPGVTRTAHNPDHAEGLSTSLRAGLTHVPADVDAVLVALGDMPGLTPALVGQIVAAFDPAHGRAIVVPTAEGRRGNPVLWASRFRDELKTLQGDVGARHLLGIHGNAVAEVPVTGEGVLLDVDTPEALASARRLFGQD